MGSLRIIAGQWRSRRINAPPAEQTRPMPDRVKEAIFGILGSHFDTPGELPSFAVADLFAGSGSLGLEAVSRGAAGCVFFERDRAALHVLHGNIAGLDPSGTLLVSATDMWRLRDAKLTSPWGDFGIIFLDPPYRDARDTGPESRLVRLIEQVCRSDHLRPDAVLVVHHERRITVSGPTPETWTAFDRREYGSTAITFIRPVRAVTDPSITPDQVPDGTEPPQICQADTAPEPAP